jgi:dipeptidyl aminopeptidase/acylaminoacyl peptidase
MTTNASGCFFRSSIVIGLIVVLCPPVAAVPHNIDELYRHNVVRDAALSPEGTRAALIYRADEKAGDMLYVVDTDHLDSPSSFHKISLGAPEHLRTVWVRWVTETRLLLGTLVTQGLVTSARVEAIDADGTHPTVLFSGSKRILKESLDLSRITGLVPNDPIHIIMPAWTNWTYDLFNVDVITGEARQIAKGRTNTVGWDVKDGEPVLRYDLNTNGTAVSVFGHARQANEEWTFLTKYSREELQNADWSYVGAAPGADEIYIRERPPGANTAGIYTYNIDTKTTKNLIAQVSDFDMIGAINIDGVFAGAEYIQDTLTYALKDAALQKHMDGLNNYFKHQANVAIAGIDRSKKHLLLRVDGPRDPGDYYLYDISRAHLELLMSGRPWLDPDRLASTDVRKITMRDGAQITAYVTGLGSSTNKRPLVVMPHGGPELRDSIQFNPLVQAFAAQGWLVLQVNFRGSDGYGAKFAEAGHRQWSHLMQDDVTDSVGDLIHAALVQPDRIVIYGASYGGYAALAGAVTTPDLYRAAVARAGVSDLTSILRYERYRGSGDDLLYDHWVKLIGDPKTDGEDLRAASPSQRANEIHIPVLLMHGSADKVVPVEQSRIMKASLERERKSVRLEIFEGEGHSYWSQDNEIKQTNDAIAFFKQVID